MNRFESGLRHLFKPAEVAAWIATTLCLLQLAVPAAAANRTAAEGDAAHEPAEEATPALDTHADEIVVTGRRKNLLGSATTASEGRVGAR